MIAMRKRIGPNSGFTLVEVLVAVAIISMIISTLAGTMRLGIRSWERGEGRSEDQQRFRVLTEQMIEDIRSAYQADSETVTSFAGRGDRVTLHTTARGLGPRSDIYGIRRISYYVNTDGQLIMEESYPFDEEAEKKGSTPLHERFKGIQFRYHRVEEENEEWVNNWDSKDYQSLPDAVEITLKPLNEGAREAILPPIIVPIYFNKTISNSGKFMRMTR